MITPSVAAPTNVILGDGVLYKDYGLATSREIGACSGSSKLVINKKFQHVDYNGMYGETTNLKYKTHCQPVLTIGLLELSPTNLADCYAGLTVTEQSTYYEVTESVTISASNYWTNLTFLGERLDGKDIFAQLDNVLGDSEKFEAEFKTDTHVVSDAQFTAHYGSTTQTTPPYRIRYYK